MRTERGDTIIEVMFAFTVFALIAVAGLSLMNQGVAMAQRSLEMGLVRQQIDAQADALRYLNRAFVADYGNGGQSETLWREVAYNHVLENGTVQPFDQMVEGRRCVVPERAFALDIEQLGNRPVITPRQSDIDSMPTYARINREYPTEVRAEGIWIQTVRSNETTAEANKPGFYDFHIRACWYAPGLSAPMTMGTIVRLYEPRG